MFNKFTTQFQWGQHQVVMETGEIARQATGAVMLNMEGTTVLATVVAKKAVQAGQDFFPLTVDYVEKAYAAGKVPGGFFKREGKPSEHETLTSRLIDRPIRPLFPEQFFNEVQIIVHVLSLNPEVPADIAAMIASSAALAVSGIPFNGPIGAARVAFCNGQYLLNPNRSQMQDTDLDLVVAGTESAVLMVESQANQLTEEVMLGAVMFGHQQMQAAIDAIHELVAKAGKPEWDWTKPETDATLMERIAMLAQAKLEAAYAIVQKSERSQAIADVCSHVKGVLVSEGVQIDNVKLDELLFNLQSNIVRSKILNGDPRIDGRDTRSVRPIDLRVSVLPRTHGSALFTRGETQSLAIATLGTSQDEQIIDALQGEYRDRFMLHYNMPPFATGETGRVGSPKRREIGHGKLAKRALEAVLPSYDAFAYTIRLVSEITESNGSSSMASVCAGCLAMMDAGVPIKDHVAGIAMGLIKEGNRFAVLTDILGDEDHLGDMDFKVAGTLQGITALQMDIKIQGITKEIMQVALAQAKEGRMHILAIMREKMGHSRSEVSTYAPRMLTMKIHPERIRDVIGKGGATIRSITEETGTKIDIAEDGTITIASVDPQKAEDAKVWIQKLTVEVELGQIYEGTVIKVMDFGALINLLPGKDGLLHISQISHERVRTVADHLKEGQVVRVKVIEIDSKGRVRLSKRALEEPVSADITTKDGDEPPHSASS